MLDRADPTLLAAVDLAREALLDVTPADTIGEVVGHVVEGERVLTLLFDCTMSGYPGWRWTVSLSRIDEDSTPSVLETELTPGGEALVAPDWIPWSDRLADYRTAQELAAAVAAAETLDTDDDDDDDVDDDESEDDDESDENDDEESDDDEDDEPDEDPLALDDDDDFHDRDVLDGIDFGEALSAPELNPADADEPQAEADGGARRPPAKSRRRKVALEEDSERQG